MIAIPKPKMNCFFVETRTFADQVRDFARQLSARIARSSLACKRSCVIIINPEEPVEYPC